MFDVQFSLSHRLADGGHWEYKLYVSRAVSKCPVDEGEVGRDIGEIKTAVRHTVLHEPRNACGIQLLGSKSLVHNPESPSLAMIQWMMKGHAVGEIASEHNAFP